MAVACSGESSRVPGPGGGASGASGRGSGGASGSGGSTAGGTGGGGAGRGQGGTATAGRGGGRSGAGNVAGEAGGGSGGRAGSAAHAGSGGDAGDGAAGSAGGTPGAPCGATRSCTGDYLHRSEPVSCPFPERDADGAAGAPVVPEDCPDENEDCSVRSYECSSDDECASLSPNSYCLFVRTVTDGRLIDIWHRCEKSCETDAQCGAGEICSCRTATKERTRENVSMGSCTRSGCAGDADCADGYRCIAPAPNSPAPARGAPSFNCQSAEDECWGAADCPDRPASICNWRTVCRYDGSRFACDYTSDVDEEDCS